MAAAHDVVDSTTDTVTERATVLLYSDNRGTREDIKTLVGRRAAADTPLIAWEEVATDAAVLERVKAGGIDLIVLDAETGRVGGIGLCRTLKTSIYQCPPVVLLIARQQDAWLASWSEADGVVSAPLDPVELQQVVAAQLRAHT
ncbi:MAG: hypothetical protein ACK5H2_11820 [Beutenbergiaceae bacterium]